MNDEYVEEIREIRNRQYEETKDMSLEDQIAYTRERAERFEKRVEEYRKRNATTCKTGRLESANR